MDCLCFWLLGNYIFYVRQPVIGLLFSPNIYRRNILLEKESFCFFWNCLSTYHRAPTHGKSWLRPCGYLRDEFFSRQMITLQTHDTQENIHIRKQYTPAMTLHTFKRQLKVYPFHIWCAGEQKEHSPPPGAVVAFSYVILAPDIKLQTCLLTYQNTKSCTKRNSPE